MDIVPKKVIIFSLIGAVGLVLLFNYGFKHNDSHDITNRFDIKQIAELSSKHVTLPHPSQLEDKLKALISGGKTKLHVILDFDKTLTKYKDENNNKVKTTHDVFNYIETVPKSYKEESWRLYSMYGPIEIDPTIDIHDKMPFMEQWVHDYQDIVKEIVMNDSLIDGAIRKTNLVVRNGSKEMMTLLKENSIPVLIFSAGLGDVIKAALRVHGLNMTNVHVISNFFTYDNGRITGFKGRHIHAFNKNQGILEEIDFKYAKELSDRSNVILVGDSLGDASMADGLPRQVNVLRIAFLNNKVEENLPYYEDKFDIVIAQDETMNVINGILHRIMI